MKKNQFIQSIGCLTIASLFVLPGCATQSPLSQSASAGSVAVEVVADTSAPTMPAMAAAPVVAAVEDVPKAAAPSLEVGSVASVIKKMEASPYTLYWRGKNTYTYYVGGKFDAEYKPGESLVVKDSSVDENSLTCKYDGGGSLGSADADLKMKEACSKLMFTLDSELSD